MRGSDEASGSLFSYVDLEARIPARHPLRTIRQVVNEALSSLDAELASLYTDFGRPSIAPERLIRASRPDPSRRPCRTARGDRHDPPPFPQDRPGN